MKIKEGYYRQCTTTDKKGRRAGQSLIHSKASYIVVQDRRTEQAGDSRNKRHRQLIQMRLPSKGIAGLNATCITYNARVLFCLASRGTGRGFECSQKGISRDSPSSPFMLGGESAMTNSLPNVPQSASYSLPECLHFYFLEFQFRIASQHTMYCAVVLFDPPLQWTTLGLSYTLERIMKLVIESYAPLLLMYKTLSPWKINIRFKWKNQTLSYKSRN